MENTFKTSASQTDGEMNRQQLTAAEAGVTPASQNTHLSFASPPPRMYPSAEGATGTGAQVAQNMPLSFTSPPPRPYPSAEGATGIGAQNTHLSFASPPPRTYTPAEGATGNGAQVAQNTPLSFTSPPPRPYPSAEGATIIGAQNTHLSFASPPPRAYTPAEGATGTGAQVAQNTPLSFTSPPPRPYPSAEGATVIGAQNTHLSFASPPLRTYTPAEGATGTGASLSNVNVNSSDKMTKKRGRPRKNGPDGIAVGLMAAASASAAVTPPQGPVSSAAAQPVSEGGPSKKPRGRPPGSCKKQRRRTFGSAGSGITITPHIIVAEKGEDVGQKIVSFTRQGSRTVIIMAAYGFVSKVVLIRAEATGETVTHEGQLDILSLSGSFRESIIGDDDSWGGTITIAVVRDGLVLGGNVIGDLTAASTVQIILGTFVEESERANSPPANTPPTDGTFSESFGRRGSPVNHGDPNNANMQGISNMP